MARADRRSLFDLTLAGGTGSRTLSDGANRVPFEALGRGTNLDAPLSLLRGRSVLLSSERQLPTVLAAITLDGVARRLFLCLPDIDAADLPAILEGEIDAVVSDGTGPQPPQAQSVVRVGSGSAIRPDASSACERALETEWILFTSGTTGRPKMVSHTLASLSGPLDDGLQVAPGAVWSTFYDVRRYGGLQILLRALLGGGSMVLSSAHEPVGDFLIRAGNSGVTHISGTPSHWRRALMSPAARRMAPNYVRLSGEVADQAVLDHLKQAYPNAEVAHAFASTEAGVAFDVRDGLEGFSASYIGRPDAKAELRVVAGTLRIRSQRTASRYLGGSGLADEEGFVDTGDMVERRGERYYFVGRREGVINVGGQKVYPEEVEAVINRHPSVQMSRVWPRRSPITGAVVAADVVLREGAAGLATLRESILQACRDSLPAHKVPVSLRAVGSLRVGPAGKLLRHDD
jgi:acyl-CoA synthetase (AMP-forming)/AMP-acid ligase II